MSEAEPNKSEEELSVKERMDRANEKLQLYGELGATADDHWAMGGSPPPELSGENRGKTKGETMSDEEILKYLKDQESFVRELRRDLKRDKDDFGTEQTLEVVRRDFLGAIRYLKMVGRLPEEYKDKIKKQHEKKKSNEN